MKKPKVSIIVPVHNAGKYLVECLNTLIYQTLQDIEIIIVLDCPTDGSDTIAVEYAAIDYRIKIIRNRQNMHIGNSRNIGMDNATGEYIGFSDHDDYCALDMYEKLYTKAKEKDADIVRCNYFKGDKPFIFNADMGQNNIQLLSQMFNGSVWNNIYRKDFLTANNIRFADTKITTPEDLLFSVKAYVCTNNIFTITDCLYYWRVSKNHTSTSRNKNVRISYYAGDKLLSMLENMILFLINKGVYDRFSREIWYFFVIKMYSSVFNGFCKSSQTGFFCWKEIVNKNYFRKEILKSFKKPYIFRFYKLKPTNIAFVCLTAIVSIFYGKLHKNAK
ncbi:MAG: glycosyltransferase [Culturomica sp.]|jgi:glycosyltransferase involved in cell wall biosynthesis|nr:glycosyltransferase [Culturomica sp.]